MLLEREREGAHEGGAPAVALGEGPVESRGGNAGGKQDEERPAQQRRLEQRKERVERVLHLHAARGWMRVVRISGTYSCLFLIKSLRCNRHLHAARGRSTQRRDWIRNTQRWVLQRRDWIRNTQRWVVQRRDWIRNTQRYVPGVIATLTHSLKVPCTPPATACHWVGTSPEGWSELHPQRRLEQRKEWVERVRHLHATRDKVRWCGGRSTGKVWQQVHSGSPW